MQGLLVMGECLGCKSEERPFIDKATGKASTFNDTKLGVKVSKANGFEGETEVVSITLSKKHIDLGLPAIFSTLKGKLITVPVYARAFSGKSGAGVQFNLSGDGKPLE